MRALRLLIALLLGLSIAVLLAPPRRPRHVALPSPREYFSRRVVPVLDGRCGSCHGLQQALFRERGPALRERGLLRWGVDAAGHLQDDRCAAVGARHLGCLVAIDAPHER